MFQDEIVNNQFARWIIRRKVRLLIGHAGFTKQDRPDIEQELLVRLLQSLDQFDPNRRHFNVFAATVIGRAAARILRERLAKKRDNGQMCSLNKAKDGCSTEPVDPRPSHEEQVDLATDLAEVLARLPEELRDLAERLKSRSLSEVARDLGVPRTTLHRRLRRLRQCFEDGGLQIYL
jgi:RNA polymerase sigma-70 factor (ECF subfamily)